MARLGRPSSMSARMGGHGLDPRRHPRPARADRRGHRRELRDRARDRHGARGCGGDRRAGVPEPREGSGRPGPHPRQPRRRGRRGAPARPRRPAPDRRCLRGGPRAVSSRRPVDQQRRRAGAAARADRRRVRGRVRHQPPRPLRLHRAGAAGAARRAGLQGRDGVEPLAPVRTHPLGRPRREPSLHQGRCLLAVEAGEPPVRARAAAAARRGRRRARSPSPPTRASRRPRS